MKLQMKMVKNREGHGEKKKRTPVGVNPEEVGADWP
jgi:hypothetical protein